MTFFGLSTCMMSLSDISPLSVMTPILLSMFETCKSSVYW